jgi:Flp pilus assembly protein TadG
VTRPLTGQRGSATVELVLLTPLLVLIALAVLAVGRVTTARLDVEGAATQGARAASMARSPQTATRDAQDTVARSLAEDHISCSSLDTTVDTSAFEPGGWVTVTVTCHIDLDQLTGLALPATHTITTHAAAVVDAYRSTTP